MTGLSGFGEPQKVTGSQVGLAARQWKNQPLTQASLLFPLEGMRKPAKAPEESGDEGCGGEGQAEGAGS